jgi:hypothetical protein
MLEFNHGSINELIKTLDESIELHRKSTVLYPTCNCKELESQCYFCKSLKIIGTLSCLKSHLNPLNKNTINHTQFIDVESFCYSLGKTGHVESIEIKPLWNNLNPKLPNSEKPIGFEIFVETSRYAMDGNGYHVGYEDVTYKWKAQSKRELGIAGIPYLLSSWVVNPNEFEIESMELPPDDIPEHDPECEFKDNPDSFDDCECAEFFEGYYHPDDDFFYQEIQSILESCNWVEAEFNSDTREWTLGYTSFNVNEYQTNQDYADSCNEDNGMPSFGNYC